MNDKIKENLLDQSCAPTDNLQSNWDRIDWTKAEQACSALVQSILSQFDCRLSVGAHDWSRRFSLILSFICIPTLKSSKSLL